MTLSAQSSAPPSTRPPLLSNADVARQLAALAQLLAGKGENPYKIKAYRRAAETIQSLPESVAEQVEHGADLTVYAGIGSGIASAIREIVSQGGLRALERLRSEVSPELAALSEFPRLDPKRVQQIYRKLGISSVEALRQKFEAGEIGRQLGPRVEHHVRRALVGSHEILLYDADDIAESVAGYLRERCGVRRTEPTGDFRRRVETIGELSFLIATDDFAVVVATLQRYGGRTELVSGDDCRATLRLPIGILLTVETAPLKQWGIALMLATGSERHLDVLQKSGYRLAKLTRTGVRFATEAAVYRKLGLAAIPPELREGNGEVALAVARQLPRLVTTDDLRGELHCHTTASDGAATIEEMAEAARQRGYEYLGVSDHSQSLKIAGGVSEDDLWKQIRRIDRLNAKLRGFRILKSAEVDIRADGTLDYPDALLRELDYTVCSIHSRFGLNETQQTERILRAMDNPHFTILGHATGRLLLRRPGYRIDIERIITAARARSCFFEINSSPDRLDLSADHARLAREAGVKIAICTDAHSPGELDYMRCGIDQARRAGLAKTDVLNCMPWERLQKTFKR